MIYTLNDLIASQRSKNPHKIAIIDGSDRLSFEELDREVRRYASEILVQGIKHGDRVAIFLQRSIKQVCALFGVWLAGGVAVLINDVLKGRQINYILQHSEANLLITDKRLNIPRHVEVTGVPKVLLVEEIPPSTKPYSASGIIGADLGMIIYTSGSTGMPKGIMLTHSNLLSGAFIVSDYLKLTDNDILISLLPFSFDYGLNQLLTGVLIGGTMVIQRSVMPADICHTLVNEKVTGLACVPMLWQQLVHERSPFTKMNFPHLRYMTNTGGRMPEHITKKIRTAHPLVQLYLMFGLTEAFRSTFLSPQQVDIRPTSIGKAIPNVEILVLNEQGKQCAPGEIGELVHRGANISSGYWKDPESTAQRFRPAPFQQGKNGQAEIAVYSGDYVKTDDEGYLYFVSRKDQMIKSRGMRVSPEEVEEYLFSSNLVSHAVAFCVPRDDVETVIVAAVVPVDERKFSEENLLRYCKREMPEYMQPRLVWSCENFPLTSTGKPDRLRIKELFLQAHPIL